MKKGQNMKNSEVCSAIKKLKVDRNFFSEQCTNAGYGQNTGGWYRKGNKKVDENGNPLTQQNHFISYYDKENKDGKKKEKITYGYLRCPQLLLFIAESAGLREQYLQTAYEFIRNYEDELKIRNNEKNGNYMWGTWEFKRIKCILCMRQIVDIIKKSSTWEEVQKQVKEL